MSTSSGSRVLRDGTMATSSKPYARRADFPMPISMSATPPTSSRHPDDPDTQRTPARGRAGVRDVHVETLAGAFGNGERLRASVREARPPIVTPHDEGGSD